jgi:hypothetical protein
MKKLRAPALRLFRSRRSRWLPLDVLPDQGRERAEITGGELDGPVRLSDDLLDHQRVDVDHGVLEQVQRQHADFQMRALSPAAPFAWPARTQ